MYIYTVAAANTIHHLVRGFAKVAKQDASTANWAPPRNSNCTATALKLNGTAKGHRRCAPDQVLRSGELGVMVQEMCTTIVGDTLPSPAAPRRHFANIWARWAMPTDLVAS